MADAPVLAGDTVVLVDTSAMIFRGYHSARNLSRASDGLPTGATFRVMDMLWRVMTRPSMLLGRAPSHIAVVLDGGGRNHRHDLDPAYKANRSSHPSDLTLQRPYIARAIAALGLQTAEAAGCEADDLIASYARSAADQRARVVILSADKDLMQLVTNDVLMIDTQVRAPGGERTVWTEAAVRNRWGVPPRLLGDLLALTGDTSDGIPGVPGVGAVTAAKWLLRFGDLDAAIDRAAEIDGAAGRALRANVDSVRLARQLVHLRDDLVLPYPLSAFGLGPVDYDAIFRFCEEMEFPSIAATVRRHAKGERP